MADGSVITPEEIKSIAATCCEKLIASDVADDDFDNNENVEEIFTAADAFASGCTTPEEALEKHVAFFNKLEQSIRKKFADDKTKITELGRLKKFFDYVWSNYLEVDEKATKAEDYTALGVKAPEREPFTATIGGDVRPPFSAGIGGSASDKDDLHLSLEKEAHGKLKDAHLSLEQEVASDKQLYLEREAQEKGVIQEALREDEDTSAGLRAIEDASAGLKDEEDGVQAGLKESKKSDDNDYRITPAPPHEHSARAMRDYANKGSVIFDMKQKFHPEYRFNNKSLAETLTTSQWIDIQEQHCKKILEMSEKLAKHQSMIQEAMASNAINGLSADESFSNLQDDFFRPERPESEASAPSGVLGQVLKKAPGFLGPTDDKKDHEAEDMIYLANVYQGVKCTKGEEGKDLTFSYGEGPNACKVVLTGDTPVGNVWKVQLKIPKGASPEDAEKARQMYACQMADLMIKNARKRDEFQHVIELNTSGMDAKCAVGLYRACLGRNMCPNLKAADLEKILGTGSQVDQKTKDELLAMMLAKVVTFGPDAISIELKEYPGLRNELINFIDRKPGYVSSIDPDGNLKGVVKSAKEHDISGLALVGGLKINRPYSDTAQTCLGIIEKGLNREKAGKAMTQSFDKTPKTSTSTAPSVPSELSASTPTASTTSSLSDDEAFDGKTKNTESLPSSPSATTTLKG